MQLTTLHFPFSLHAGDIPKLRAAIIGSLGFGHTLFNGFDNSEPGKQKYANTYPLVTYGAHRGRGRIQGIGAGADAILRYLTPNLPDQLLLGERYVDVRPFRVEVSDWQPEILPAAFTFGLYRYVALNGNNYREWKRLEGKAEAREMLLGRCLTGHLRALAETVAPSLDRRQIEARILSVDKVKRLRWHGTQLVGFDLVACANFIPPFGLGVGRCHSFGFGEVCGREDYHRLTRPKNRTAQAAVR